MSEHQPRAPQETPEAQLAAAANGVSNTRRRLLRAGAIGAPALIALKPAAVTACDCKMPSGFTVSGNLSRGNKGCASPGRTPSRWTSSYSSLYTSFKTKKASELGLTTTTTYPNGTLANWLAKGDSHEQALIVACYLEAVAYGNDANWPKKERFVAMWNQGVIGGSYLPPNQTTPWNKAKVIAYLKFLTGQIPV